MSHVGDTLCVQQTKGVHDEDYGMDGGRQYEDKKNFSVPFAFLPQDTDLLNLMKSAWDGFQ
jgi:hypothetical protein